jgi:hypothetical protein
MSEDERTRLLRLRQAQARAQSTPQGGPVQRVMGAVNQGIARSFDSMAGPLNRGVNAVLGTELSETPTADLMDMGGVARREPEGRAGQALVGAGEAAGYLVPMAGAMRAAMGGAGLAARAGQTMAGPFINAPVSAISAEMAAGAGARAAGDYAREEYPDNAFAQGMAELGGGIVGGLGTAAAAGGARAISRLSPVLAAGRGVRAAVAPFTRGGAQVIAEDSMRRSAADPDRAAGILLDQENVGNLTPAQQTGEPGLMALERSYAQRNPAMLEELARREAASRTELQGAAREGAQGRTTRDTRQFFNERIDRHRQFLSGLVQRAEKRADDALRGIEPRGEAMANSEGVRAELDRAFDIARAQERRLWEQVPRNVEIDTSTSRQALANALEETGPVSADSIPFKARQFLGEDGLPQQASMRDLHRLYSEMRREARVAMSQNVPDEFRARQANGIAEAILRDIEAHDGPQNVARLLADARAFSSEMNEQFGQSTVARVTASARTGADRVDPQLTLDASIGAGGNRGAVAVDQIRRAVGSAADGPMEDYLRGMTQRAIVRGDRVSVERADSFIRNNDALIARFPDGFQPALDRAVDTARNAVRLRGNVDDALKVLGDRNAPGMVGFVNAKAGQEVARGIFEAENPVAAARALANAAQRDPSGDAYLGLKGGLVDEVIRRATSGNELRGDSMARVLADPEMNRVLRAVLPAEELSRLQVIAGQARKLDQWQSASPDDFQNTPNTIVATFLEMQAAKAGRAMGTGTIQVPGMFVRRTRNILHSLFNDRADALIHDAIRDPKLMAALLVGPGSRREQVRRAEQTLTNWAIGTAGASVNSEDEQ